MKDPARVAGEPGFDGRRFMGGVIVEHQMDVEIGRHGLLDLRQEFAKFDCAVALVVMAAPLDLPRPHRQQRLNAVERLDLRLFVDAQHQGAVGWVEVELNDVAHLVDKQRIGRQLEGFDAVRLQSEGAKCAPRSRSRYRCAAPCCGCSSAWLRAAGSPASAR